MFRLTLAAVTLFTASLSSPQKTESHPGIFAAFGMSAAYGFGEGLGSEIGRGIGDLISPRSYGYYNANYQTAQAYYGAPYTYGGTQSAYAAPDCSRPATVSTVQYAAPVYSTAPVYSA